MKLDISEIKKNFQTNAVVAITLTRTGVDVTVVREEAGSITLLQNLSLPITPEIISKETENAAQTLKEALANAGVRERRCVVCIPQNCALSASTDLPPVTGEDLYGYLELRAEREFPIPPSELRLGYSPYTLPGATEQNATLAAIPKKRFSCVEKFVQGAGLRPVSVSLNVHQYLQETGSNLHLVFDGEQIGFMVTADSGIASLRTFTAGSRDDDASLAALTRELRIAIGRLPEPIRKQLRTVEFAGNYEIASEFATRLRPSFERLGIRVSEPKPQLVTIEHPAVLAARRFLTKQSLSFEFVTLEPTRWELLLKRFEKKQNRIIAAATAAVIILPILTFSIRSHIENSLQDEWNSMRGEVSKLANLQNNIRRFHPWFNAAPETVQMMEGLVTAFPEQGDVWAKSVQIAEGSKVTCTGFATSQSALMGLLDRLRARKDVSALQVQHLRGNNPIQFSVTYKWAPIHEN
jgi:hypothetical protein